MSTGELVEGRRARILFDSGSAVVPADTSARLSGVLGTLAADAAAQVRVSGFHDASGDAAANEALAKQRAEAIQQWLVVNGVAVERITLDKPAQTTGSGDADEARRVDVRVE
ncbi:OmpA family protein [Pseudoxanthomonas sp.]|uniref:OmpA family protein n=1 Tax=Pseudoxanthomonas sp. TaxID=1871049 RepID=UPI002E15D0F8|nr:OmpA family protein [Pseudoxanthomonas sp.]